MNITDFEADVEDKILARGKRYFADEMIRDLWSEAPNHYQAVVDGSILYDVDIRMNADGEILSHDCDCPYDWGEYCKHEVAVLLEIRKRLAQGTSFPSEGKRSGMRAVLQAQSHEVLVDLLCELALEYDLQEEVLYLLEDEDEDDD